MQICAIIYTMPKSKKPKKAYRKKYPEGQLPIVFRHSNESDLSLKVIPKKDLEKLRIGEADEYTINTLAFRLNWGYVMAGEIFDTPEARSIMEKSLEALRSVKERREKTGKYGVTGDEFFAMGDALNMTDEMQAGSTRREQQKCLDALYLINEHLKEN